MHPLVKPLQHSHWLVRVDPVHHLQRIRQPGLSPHFLDASGTQTTSSTTRTELIALSQATGSPQEDIRVWIRDACAGLQCFTDVV